MLTLSVIDRGTKTSHARHIEQVEQVRELEFKHIDWEKLDDSVLTCRLRLLVGGAVLLYPGIVRTSAGACAPCSTHAATGTVSKNHRITQSATLPSWLWSTNNFVFGSFTSTNNFFLLPFLDAASIRSSAGA